MTLSLPACRRAITVFGAAVVLGGCEGLDYSAAGEGTGVQIIGAIVVLAKYHASPHQMEAVRSQASRLVLAAAKPAYEKRRRSLEAQVRKAIPPAQHHAKKGNSSNAVASSAAPSDSFDRSEASSRDRALERSKAEVLAELEALDAAWRSLGATPERSAPDIKRVSTPLHTVPPASTRDREALISVAASKLNPVIAIPVQNDERPLPKGARTSVMLWDTRHERFASEDVLVLDRQPSAGKEIRVDGMVARFTGY